MAAITQAVADLLAVYKYRALRVVELWAVHSSLTPFSPTESRLRTLSE